MNPFLSIHGKISRRNFTILGGVLFAIKYNIDRLIAVSFGKSWFITDYFKQADHLSITTLSPGDQKFYLILIVVSLPFIWLGTLLCLKRLRDSALPLWLVAFFFVPLINILFFFILCILPSASIAKDNETKPPFLQRIIPSSETGSILFSIGITLIVALAFTLLSVNVLQEYGWGLFVGIPFFISFCSVLLYSYHHQPVSIGKAIGIGATGISLFALFIFLLAMEGVICLVMAAPFGYVIGIIGSMLAYGIQFQHPGSTLNSIAVNVLFLPAIMLMEQSENLNPPVYELKTTIVVNESREKVWDHLVSFNKIDPPDEFIFKTGIAYPQDAEITGKGVGAIRKCNFTTGAFVEPIIVWDEPNLLKFDVLQEPPPLFELSFYDNVQAPHLDGYFMSKRGQFKLTKISDHQTLLEGTTWYQNKMWPSGYWKQWSDFILHQIHLRVLRHIKKMSEQDR